MGRRRRRPAPTDEDADELQLTCHHCFRTFETLAQRRAHIRMHQLQTTLRLRENQGGASVTVLRSGETVPWFCPWRGCSYGTHHTSSLHPHVRVCYSLTPDERRRQCKLRNPNAVRALPGDPRKLCPAMHACDDPVVNAQRSRPGVRSSDEDEPPPDVSASSTSARHKASASKSAASHSRTPARSANTPPASPTNTAPSSDDSASSSSSEVSDDDLISSDELESSDEALAAPPPKRKKPRPDKDRPEEATASAASQRSPPSSEHRLAGSRQGASKRNRMESDELASVDEASATPEPKSAAPKPATPPPVILKPEPPKRKRKWRKEGDPFMCPIIECSEVFDSEHQLRGHRRLCHQMLIKKIVFPLCPEGEKVIENVVRDEDGEFHCPAIDCWYSHASPELLRKHAMTCNYPRRLPKRPSPNLNTFDL